MPYISRILLQGKKFRTSILQDGTEIESLRGHEKFETNKACKTGFHTHKNSYYIGSLFTVAGTFTTMKEAQRRANAIINLGHYPEELTHAIKHEKNMKFCYN